MASRRCLQALLSLPQRRVPALNTVSAAVGLLAQPSCSSSYSEDTLVPSRACRAHKTWVHSQVYAQQRQYGAAAAALNVSTVQIDSSSALLRGPESDVVGHTYRVTVVTGNCRGAGTHGPALLQLVGSDGVSEKWQLGDCDSSRFDRGSVRTFSITSGMDIGMLRHVHLEKKKDHSATGDGWFLKHIEVKVPTGETLFFPCNSWLGASDSGGSNGPLEMVLAPAATEQASAQPPLKPQPVKVTASGIAIPHPEKVMKRGAKGHNTKGFGHAGEDAYFICHGGKGGRLFAMGVADGVYMWREHGIDAGVMSRSLMERCQQLIQAGGEDVYQVLHQAVTDVRASGAQGSATVCLLAVDSDSGRVSALNLGDSGFMVIGKNKASGELEVKFRTTQLEHEFGRPYQIGHHAASDQVSDADLASLQVWPGDVIVMGSDGLLDNLADAEVVQAVSGLQRPGAALVPSRLAQSLLKAAFDASVDKHRDTPYSRSATEAFDLVFQGGKQDDITVVVAVCS